MYVSGREAAIVGEMRSEEKRPGWEAIAKMLNGCRRTVGGQWATKTIATKVYCLISEDYTGNLDQYKSFAERVMIICSPKKADCFVE